MDYDTNPAGAVLALNEKLPRITLASPTGPLKLSSYEQKRNLLIVLMDPEQEENSSYLRALAELNDEFRELATTVLVVGPHGQPRGVPEQFTPAWDEAGSLRKRFLPAEAPADAAGIWLSDRFGELYHQSIAAGAGGLTPPEEVLQWVQLVEAQCP